MTDEPDITMRNRLSIGRVLIMLSWLGSIGLVAAGTWSSYCADLRNDQYQLINLGQCVYDGGRMYVDCWENKPPGIAWLNAAAIALGGGRQIGAWLLPGVMLLACLIVMGWAVRSVLSLAASTAAVLLGAIVMTLRLYDTPSINPDCYSAMLELLAGSVWLAALCTARTPRRVALAVVAGLLWAAAATVKQTGCVGLLAVTLVTLVLVIFKRSDKGRWALAGGLAWAGFVIGLGGVVSILAYRDTLGPAWEAVFTFNRGLFSWSGLAEAAASWSRQQAGLKPVQLGLFLALLGTVTTFCAGKDKGTSPAIVTVLLLWWIAQVLFALLGPSRSMRYWQATFPPMLWLAGAGFFHLEALFRRADKPHRIPLAIMSIALLALLGRPLVDHYRYGLATSYLASVSDETQRDRLGGIGRRLSELVPIDARIYVWAYDAGVYLSASRRPACRFTYPRCRWQVQEILSDLAAGNAQAILIPKTPSSSFAHWCDAACQEQLGDILSRYEEKAAVADYRVWALSDSVDQ